MSYPTSKFTCPIAAYSASSYSIQMKQTKTFNIKLYKMTHTT